MADRAALEAAAQAGVISAEQVGALDQFLNASAAKPATISGEEDLRFIRNFHDVFLAIGIVLLAIGMGVAIGTATANAKGMGVAMTGQLALGAAIVLWLLGEFFARRRRLFLPAIAIVCCFAIFVVIGAASLYFGLVLNREVNWNFNSGLPPEMRNGLLIAIGCGALAPALFYARFRLPFSLGLAGGMGAVFVIAASMIANWDMTTRILPMLQLALGVLLFLSAVAFDARDPERQTRLSDNGFWLHFAAAPLILNGVFGLIGMVISHDRSANMMWSGGAGVAQAAATLVAILFLGFLSLLINRRALIVSALLTAGIAIGALLNAVGLGAGALAGATLITLGAFVLILGAGWHGARRALLGWVKPQGVLARVFPPETSPL